MEPTWWRISGFVVLILSLLAALLYGHALNGGHALPIDIILALGVVAVIALAVVYSRRHRQVPADEFLVAKTRYATYGGFMIGLVLYCLASLWPFVHPASYHAALSRFGTEDGYSIGRVSGMVPFVVGMWIGQVAAWLKYR
jgi:hypothetical protein